MRRSPRSPAAWHTPCDHAAPLIGSPRGRGHRVESQSALVVASATGAGSNVLSFLKSRGYVCVVAGTVGEALKALEHQNFTFSVVDLELVTANGRDLVQSLKAQRGDPGPIIALSEGQGGGALERSPLLAVDALLQAPVTPADVDRAIAAVLAPPPRIEADAPSPTIRQEIDLWQSAKMRD